MNNLEIVRDVKLIQSLNYHIDPYYNVLRPASKLYPNFFTWYHSKVLTGIASGERQFITEERNNNIAGIAIIKNTSIENKLSTLRISTQYQNKGIGLKLFKKCFEALGTEKPFLTVSEEKLPEFDRIFRFFNFELTDVITGMYRKGKKEYYFNQ